jgi:hypothetical protein
MLTHSTLRPKASSRTTSKRLGRGLRIWKRCFLLVVAVKVKRLELVKRSILSSKVDRLHFTCVFQNSEVVHILAKNPFNVVQLSDLRHSLMQVRLTITLETLIEAGYVRGQNHE